MNSEGQGFRGDFGFLPKSFRSMILFRGGHVILFSYQHLFFLYCCCFLGIDCLEYLRCFLASTCSLALVSDRI